MCKPKPGPRCSDHTHQAWMKATAALNEAKQGLEAAQYEYDISESPQHRQQAQVVLERLRQRYQRRADRVDHAREEWESTPEGQQKLKEMISIAENRGNPEKVVPLKKRLETAQRLRGEHMEAHRIIRGGEKALEAMELNDRSRFATREQEVEALGAEVSKSAREVQAAHQEVQTAQRHVDREIRRLRAMANMVSRSHDDVVSAAREEYLKQDIPAERAKHYALDTANSMHSGWYYLTEDSTDRAPLYGNPPTPKVKGDGHEDADRTRQAAWGMEHSNEYTAAVASTASVHNAYHNRMSIAAEKKDHLKTTREVLDAKIATFDKHQAAYLEAQRSYNHDFAVKTGFDRETTTYTVDSKRFVKSAYVNSDGSTNAYVLCRMGKKNEPRYVPVREIGRDHDGQHLILTTGEKVSSAEVVSGERGLLLTAPGEGARKLFS